MSEVTSIRCDHCQRDLNRDERPNEIGGADFCQDCSSKITLREAFDIAHRLQHGRDMQNYLNPETRT